ESGLLALGDPVFSRPDAGARSKPANDLPSGGLLITTVAPDGLAAKAQLQPGDVLVRYGDTELKSVDQLDAAIQARTAAKAKDVQITIWREGVKQPFTRKVPPGQVGVVLDKRPAREAITNRRQTDALLLGLRGGNWPDLPGTRVEVTQLAKLVGDQTAVLIDSNASEQSLEQLRRAGDLSKYRYLHFATHGAANNVRAFESVLILAQDKLPADPLPRAGEPFLNGQLSAGEVLEFWKLNADLVTLSACETALGRHGGGDGLLGFAQAFLTAGSRSVCVSLWKVDDTATALLMTRFYQNLLGKRPGLKQPMPKARALAEAKVWLRNLSADEVLKLTAAATNGVVRGNRGEEVELLKSVVLPKVGKNNKLFAHPRYWSAFILIGDSN
ncbi:MAG: CHAT domain-containing protein, partial [Planctomycetes bacterium]|nr:CHAT domain-containing protein [Planctomycetota bacterium]